MFILKRNRGRVTCSGELRLWKKAFLQGRRSPFAWLSPGLLSQELDRLPRSLDLQPGGLFPL
jgi:hypothetical protein